MLQRKRHCAAGQCLERPSLCEVSALLRRCLATMEQADVRNGEEVALSVATYNLLHPKYAVFWGQEEGINASGDSNWPQRMPCIAALLRDGDLDVYLLQEVGLDQLVDLRQVLGGRASPRDVGQQGIVGYTMDLGEYMCVHFTHPGRAARDGVAILLRRDRLWLRDQWPVPLLGEGGVPYMCAAVALAEDSCGRHVVFSSVHFYYSRSAVDPEVTLLWHLAHFEQKLRPVAALVWGGDCNRIYEKPPPGFAFHPHGMADTRPSGQWKKIDWIFATTWLARSFRTQKFIDSTCLPAAATGTTPSDHRGEALVIVLPSHGFAWCWRKE